MHAGHWKTSGSVAFFVLALVVACSKAKSGETCKHDNDCESGTCALNGRCAPGDCSCAGAACGNVRASCDEGSVCVAGTLPFEVGYNHCRQLCTPQKSCPADQHCSGGVCAGGAEAFSLTWESFPRAVKCAVGVPCQYKVRVPAGVTVTTFTWTFGTAAPVDTKEPMTAFTYKVTGSYQVRVHAVATNGAPADLAETEVLCDGGAGAACDPTGAPCCEGSCNAKSVCQ